MTDNGFEAGNVIELAFGPELEVIVTSVASAGGVTGLATIIGSILKRNRDKEYKVYVINQPIELKGISAREAERIIAERTRSAVGGDPEESADDKTPDEPDGG